MTIVLEYDESKGIYLLDKIRVIVLPKGSIEVIQNSVNSILGLATKGIFQEVASTVFYSFIQDLIKTKAIRFRGSSAKNELFDLFNNMGFGRITEITQDLNSSKISIEGNYNSYLNIISNSAFCFNSIGLLNGIYRSITNRDVEVIEKKCRSTGDSDADFFDVNVSETKSQYNYIPSQFFEGKNEQNKKVDIVKDEKDIFINLIPSEIIPVTYFPYLFSKLRKIIGQGVYGIENQAGKEVAKLYQQYNLGLIQEKYNLKGLEVMSIISGIGKIETIKTELGYLKDVVVNNSFNALHIDEAIEKRCFLLASLISALSYKLTGNILKLNEKECSAVNNNNLCKFSFQE